jgi:hypothetical protein
MAIIARNIARIEAVPPELPEYADGVLTRIQFPHGEYVYVREPYEDVITAWEATLESLD